MKFSIEKNKILKSLEEVIRAIDPNNIYMHLRNFYIEILDEEIIIKGSNGYFSIENTIKNESTLYVEKIGKLLVPSNLFLNIVKKCSGKILLYSENNILYIENNLDKYQINLLDYKEYPVIDFSLYGNKIKVEVEKIKKAINNVIFASSQTKEDFILTGINIKYEDNKLMFTATDSFRLAREVIEIKDDRNISFDVTVVNKNLKNFIPNDAVGEIEFYANEHKINVVYNNSNYQSKIIDAPYKNVSQLFKVNFSKKITIDKTILNNAISKATVMSNDVVHNKIFVFVNKEEMKLSTHTDSIGSTSVILKNNEFQYEGEEIQIILNYKFLKEAINVFNDKINIHLIDSKNLILIDSEKSLNKQIISPMVS